MKKLLALLLCAVLCLSLAACASNTATTTTTTEPAASTETAAETPAAEETAEAPAEEAPDAQQYVVGICQLVQHDALDAATNGFMDALNEALPGQVTFDLKNASNDIPTCGTIVTGFVASNVDLILANGNARPAGRFHRDADHSDSRHRCYRIRRCVGHQGLQWYRRRQHLRHIGPCAAGPAG